jgi:hypothetical protein
VLKIQLTLVVPLVGPILVMIQLAEQFLAMQVAKQLAANHPTKLVTVLEALLVQRAI